MKNMKKKTGLALALIISMSGVVQTHSFANSEISEDFNEINAIGEISDLGNLDFDDYAGNADLLGIPEEMISPSDKNVNDENIDLIEEDLLDPSNFGEESPIVTPVPDTDENKEPNETLPSQPTNDEAVLPKATEGDGSSTNDNKEPIIDEVTNPDNMKKPEGADPNESTDETKPLEEIKPIEVDNENAKDVVSTEELENIMKTLESELANKKYTVDSISNAKKAIETAKSLLGNDELKKEDIERQISLLKTAKEGLIVDNVKKDVDTNNANLENDSKKNTTEGQEPKTSTTNKENLENKNKKDGENKKKSSTSENTNNKTIVNDGKKAPMNNEPSVLDSTNKENVDNKNKKDNEDNKKPLKNENDSNKSKSNNDNKNTSSIVVNKTKSNEEGNQSNNNGVDLNKNRIIENNSNDKNKVIVSSNHMDDLKPEELEGKKPGEYEEWVDNDYVDSNKTPAKSLEELVKNPNAAEVKESTDTLKKNTPKANIANRVNAQTGGKIGMGVAIVLGVVAAVFFSRRKK